MLVRFVRDLVGAATRRGVDRSTLVVGMPGLADADRNARIPWDEFVDLMRRLETAVGGPAGLEALGSFIGQARVMPVMRRVAGLSASPVLLYRAGERFALPRAMPLLRSSLEETGPPRPGGARKLRLTCEIPEWARPCPQILHMGTGSLRSLPSVLGLPAAAVEAHVTGRRAEYRVLVPPSGTPWARLWVGARSLLSGRATLAQLAAQQRELREHFEQQGAAHERLVESEARFRAFCESAIDIVAELSSDGEILYISPSMRERTGYAPEEVTGTSLAVWIHPDDVQGARAALGRALCGVDKGRSVFRVRRREGDWIWLETEGSSYRTREGETRAVAILRDVSERVRLEEQQQQYRRDLEREVQRRTRQLERRNRELRELQTLLLEAERIGAAHDLAGRVAHSIANPLSVLVGQLRLALDEDALPPGRIEALLELAQRVSQVMERTLELYRERKIDRTPVDVAGVLDEVRAQLGARARERSVGIEIRCDPAAPTVPADRPLLVAALASLAENAIDATPEGGRIRIATRLDARAGRLAFRVVDGGPGVPPELRERVFEPFFTTKGSRGTGLGLPIAQGVFQGHGGELCLEAGRRAGSAFVGSIPTDVRRAAAVPRSEPSD